MQRIHHHAMCLPVAAALAVCLSLPAQASVSVNYNNLTVYNNSDVVFVSSSAVVTGGSEALFLRDTRGALQTFTLGSDIEISAINILVTRMVQGESFRMELRELTYDPSSSTITNTNLADNSTLLASEDVTITASQATGFDGNNDNDALSTLTWTLPSSITLNDGPTTGGNNYAFLINATSDNTGARWAFVRNGDVYANQSDPRSAIGYNEGNAANGGNYVYDSSEFGTARTSDLSLGLVQVPEPGSLALMGLGVTCLLSRHRRR